MDCQFEDTIKAIDKSLTIKDYKLQKTIFLFHIIDFFALPLLCKTKFRK